VPRKNRVRAVANPLDRCLNCGAALSGQYCGQCGQRATSRLISLWELVRDAFGDLFELDSRLWRTLIPLLARPGRLTREYLEGRRARFMPPFRMYLVLSLVFFLVAFFNPQSDFEIFFEPEEELSEEAAPGNGEAARIDAARAEGRREAREALEELVREGVIDESLLGPGGPIRLPAEPGTDHASAPEPPAAPAADGEARNEPGDLVMTFGDDDVINCESGEFDISGFPQWLQRRLTPRRIQHLCERLKAAGADGLVAELIDRIPAALILLLPLMALVLKLLYPLSRRYYVEHLLFFVHFHSFFFLLLTLQILWSRLVHTAGLHEAVAVLPIVASSIYIPAYLFVSMRRVYGQGRFVTFLKFIILFLTYLFGSGLLLLGTLLLAALAV
jgi:hypothetical protein